MHPSATRIVHRCQDLDLSLSDFPGGAIDRLARELKPEEVAELIQHLDYLARGEPSAIIRHRELAAKSFLERRLAILVRLLGEDRIQELAQLARSSGKETCECGQKHHPGANYYVSVQDGKKTGLLSGPYKTHAEAVAKVNEVKEKALEVDSGAAFYSFGTVATKTSKKGSLD